MNKRIRVVVADDSALMRKKISEILSSDPSIEVIATARNGREALEVIYAMEPDVVTLDVEMPEMNGIEVLGYLMSEKPTPCIMISAFMKEGSEETIKALEFGAVDFVQKPDGTISVDIENIAAEIIAKVKVASKIKQDNLELVWSERSREKPPAYKAKHEMKKVVAIASSTGGTQALVKIIPFLKADIAASILVVQHMPPGFTKSLAERINWQSPISVVEAEDNMKILPSQVIIAKGGLHMSVKGNRKSPRILLDEGPTRHGVRPCADIMMKSVAEIFGGDSIALVLTGMGSDGTEGASAIKRAGGTVLAQDEGSCVIYGMPRSVIDGGLADKVASLESMPRLIEGLVDK